MATGMPICKYMEWFMTIKKRKMKWIVHMAINLCKSQCKILKHTSFSFLKKFSQN